MLIGLRCRAAVVFTVQNWLGESEDAKKKSSTPGILSVLMSGTRDSHLGKKRCNMWKNGGKREQNALTKPFVVGNQQWLWVLPICLFFFPLPRALRGVQAPRLPLRFPLSSRNDGFGKGVSLKKKKNPSISKVAAVG